VSGEVPALNVNNMAEVHWQGVEPEATVLPCGSLDIFHETAPLQFTVT
jgi:hypothetical protein